jgi:DNA-directed RNA polymerase subunit RPC12/RpoP
MRNLLLKCTQCNEIFPSGISVDHASTWENIAALESTQRCRHCGLKATFKKKDYILED